MSLVNESWNISSYALAAVDLAGFVLTVCVFVYIVCSKCGQTSHPVVRAQIQTSCNFKAFICEGNSLLDFLYCRCFHNVLLEFCFIVMVCQDSYTTLSSNFDFLLHEDFSHAASPSKSSTRKCARRRESNNSSKLCTIQKGSFQCFVAAVVVISVVNKYHLIFTPVFSYFKPPTAQKKKKILKRNISYYF